MSACTISVWSPAPEGGLIRRTLNPKHEAGATGARTRATLVQRHRKGCGELQQESGHRAGGSASGAPEQHQRPSRPFHCHEPLEGQRLWAQGRQRWPLVSCLRVPAARLGDCSRHRSLSRLAAGTLRQDTFARSHARRAESARTRPVCRREAARNATRDERPGWRSAPRRRGGAFRGPFGGSPAAWGEPLDPARLRNGAQGRPQGSWGR